VRFPPAQETFPGPRALVCVPLFLYVWVTGNEVFEAPRGLLSILELDHQHASILQVDAIALNAKRARGCTCELQTPFHDTRTQFDLTVLALKVSPLAKEHIGRQDTIPF